MSDAVHQWLAAQREFVERWLAAPASDPPGAQPVDPRVDPQQTVQRFWTQVAQGLSPQAQELSRQLAQLGPGFLAGTHDALLQLFGAADSGSQDAPFGRWLDLAPIGYFREHHAHAQEFARALEECRRVAAQMSAAIGNVHAQALELLAKKTEELARASTPVSDTRKLYDLWIECGEMAFQAQARGEAFGKLQGEWVNATLRLRMAQQVIAEKFLQSLDLPTRAELNSVHKRLKELRERVTQLESKLAPATPFHGERR